MKRLKALTALTLVSASTYAVAGIATHDFIVTAVDRPLAGTSARGTFSFDEALSPPGVPTFEPSSIVDLDFAWDGTAYTELMVTTAGMFRDLAGTLVSITFGTQCIPANCFTGPGFAEDNWVLSFSGTAGSFLYARSGGTGSFTGFAELLPHAESTVPLPGALSLFGLGLLTLGRQRRSTVRLAA